MRTKRAFCLVACGCAVLSVAAIAPQFRHSDEPIDTPGLPRVLLIGDSIAQGYADTVRSELAGIANVHLIPCNGGDTDRGIERLSQWLGSGRWDVIHFNFGLHDLARREGKGVSVPLPQYAANLRTIIARLRATKARLVWATTTQVPDCQLQPMRLPRDVDEYNAVATRIMVKEGIVIDDLCAIATPEMRLPNDVHYTAEGYGRLGIQVSDAIRAMLSTNRNKGGSE